MKAAVLFAIVYVSLVVGLVFTESLPGWCAATERGANYLVIPLCK